MKCKKIIYLMFVMTMLFACKEHYTPKRTAYFRMEFPEKRNFVQYQSESCPFTFMYANIGSIEYDVNDMQTQHEHPCWFNIFFKDYNSKIYLSYTAIDKRNTLEQLIKDSYKLTFKHTIRADYIDETMVKGKNIHVDGMLYDVGGNAASGVQFYVTDSVHHFLRGSLYFDAVPNIDSLAPAIQYFREDVLHLIETIAWK
jgi:gliding motility-associated lipoprotein GldD